MKEKIKDREELRRIIEDLRTKGKRVVFTNGCFDILHVGHVRYLEQARRLGDVLVVGINSDRSVRGLKGPRRPILPVVERAEILCGLACIDYISVFEESTPYELISALRPDVLVKGGDWSKEQVVGRDVVEGAGGEVVTLPFVEGASTTNIIETILEKYEKRS
jgi:D-beta-D-heptose 7-phosphate kinase / D-beta-D-heptose 1-phosphate adenosyltransferase